ncbi:MAG: hypothetical protein JNK82_34685 [Myxococcaceae bacterium]|nr:hypothetical protein [Myxococcaceae bacterium]
MAVVSEAILSATRYFIINGGTPARIDVGGPQVMNRETGAMEDTPFDESDRAVKGISRQTFEVRLSYLRQELLEHFAATPITWEHAAEEELSYRTSLGGHELGIRVGDFPDEPLYLLRVDGHELYAVDDWPAAWVKPGATGKTRFCAYRGWLVSKPELPDDPVDHDAERLPRLGCTSLRCRTCSQAVRSVGERSPDGVVDARTLFATEGLAASPLLKATVGVRTYVCRCGVHVQTEPQQHVDSEEPGHVTTQWACAGHPAATLPRELDGFRVVPEALEGLISDSLVGLTHGSVRERDRGDGVWAARMVTRLTETPYAQQIVAVVAKHLTHADVAARRRALCFFGYLPRYASAMRPEVLLSQHGGLLEGLEHELWNAAGAQLETNTALRELARTYALDPLLTSPPLLVELGRYDRQWLRENEGRLAALT